MKNGANMGRCLRGAESLAESVPRTVTVTVKKGVDEETLLSVGWLTGEAGFTKRRRACATFDGT